MFTYCPESLTLSRAEAAILLDRLQNTEVVVDPSTVAVSADHAAMITQMKDLAKHKSMSCCELKWSSFIKTSE
jgi:hypothetical protein